MSKRQDEAVGRVAQVGGLLVLLLVVGAMAYGALYQIKESIPAKQKADWSRITR